MTQLLMAGIGIAATIGAFAGGAMQGDAYQLWDRPGGPQQIYSMPEEYGEEAYAYSTIEFPSGPFADHVIGKDWLPGGRHIRPYQASYSAYDPADFELSRVSYSVEDLNIPAPPAPPSDLEAKAATQAAQEAVEVSVTDRQAGRQIDDLAHGADEATLLDEPRAKDVSVHGLIELNDANGA